MHSSTAAEIIDVDSIIEDSLCPWGIRFSSKPAALRQLMVVREIQKLYLDSEDIIGLDVGSKYSDLNIILSHLNIKTVRLDVVPREDKRDFIVADGQRMPFANETFDFVVTSHVLAHVPDLDDFLSEVNRVLNKNGNLIILQSNRFGWWKFWGYYLKRNDRKYHVRAFDKWSITQSLARHALFVKTMFSPYFFYLHSKLADFCYSFDRRMEGKIPNTLATQWLIIARKGPEKTAFPDKNKIILAGVALAAAINSVSMKAFEVLLRIADLLKKSILSKVK